MQVKTKRLFSLLLVIILLFSNSQIACALADDAVLLRLEYPVLYPNDGLSYPDLKTSAGPNVEEIEASVDIDKFRKHLIDNFASCPDFVDITEFNIPYSAEMWSAVSKYIWYETPELFHIYGLGYSTSNGCITSIYASYRYTAEQYSTMLPEFYAGAEKLLAGIKGNDTLSDVEKALLLHDRLAVWCEYDLARLQAGTMPDESYTAYGVFAEKTAVCMGYALAYDYLLLQVGIDSCYCSSDTLNHAWNIVYVNNSQYHVDVTWDDPTYDRSGYVRHTNFLRSTEGIIEAGHNATDFYTTPADTTFDSCYWQNSEAAFQLVDGDIYYIDNSASKLKTISNGVTSDCLTLNGIWRYNASSYWPGNFSRLAFDGQSLLYTLPDAVYKYDTETGASTAIFTPEVPEDSYYSIFGFKFDDCKLICEVLNTPNFDANTKTNYTQALEHHVESDWTTLTAPTPEAEGLRKKLCINCSKVLEELTIPAISVTAKENTVIDYTNSIIFTDVFTCCDIENLINAYDSTSVAIEEGTAFYGTGTLVTVSVNGEAVHTLTIIVNGDIDGDSVCDVLDLALAQRYASGKQAPGILDIYAANCAIADKIDDTTYQDLVNKALNI